VSSLGSDIEVLRAFYPLHQQATHKAVYGGRASGKSHWAASYCIMQGTLRPRRILCCREIQHTLKDSSKQLIWDKIRGLGLDGFFTSVEKRYAARMAQRSGLPVCGSYQPAHLKSKEGIDLVWVEEASMVSQPSVEHAYSDCAARRRRVPVDVEPAFPQGPGRQNVPRW
jgi:phage terminase large subunit